MATLDVGSGHEGRRALDHQIPLIPFIDCLLCLVAFLLVTAVWSQMSRLQAHAQVPGTDVDGAPDAMRELPLDPLDIQDVGQEFAQFVDPVAELLEFLVTRKELFVMMPHHRRATS